MVEKNKKQTIKEIAGTVYRNKKTRWLMVVKLADGQYFNMSIPALMRVINGTQDYTTVYRFKYKEPSDEEPSEDENKKEDKPKKKAE